MNTIQKRAERRLEELAIDTDAFLLRFDRDGNGVLDDGERAAAIATLSHEILKEDKIATRLTSTELQPGTVLRERYEIIAEIGNGAQGIAYASRDQLTQEMVVVKQLRLAHISAWDAYDSFRRESDILAKLNHPRIPGFVDAFEIDTDRQFFYFSVQKLVPGRTLEDRLILGELFNESDLISIADQTLELLSYIHEHQPSVLHRDVKPSNILMDDDGAVFLVDFGAVQYADMSKTLAVGTAGYMPAEQLSGRAVPESDLYGLGATLVRLATKRMPQDLELQRMRLSWRHLASVSDGFANWIDKLIDPEIEDRFSSARIARKFLKNPSSVYVRREKPVESKFSLEPVEVVDQKPANSPVKLWESVDLVVSTYPPVGKILDYGMFGKFGAMVNSIFQPQKTILSENGGGFSLSASKHLTIQSVGKTQFNQKIDQITSESSGSCFLLVAQYTVSTGKSTTTAEMPFFFSKSIDDITWVLNVVGRFCRDHDLNII